MEFLNNVRDYQKYLPEYSDWEKKQELAQTQKLEYLKQHPDEFNKEDIQRGKILLHAIDVMDEYSQSYAEDMEVATETVKNEVVSMATFLGSGIGFACASLKNSGNKKIETMYHLIPAIIGGLVGFAASFPITSWATKTKVSASRKGRFEAMNNDLKNPAIFAVLTQEQKSKAENDSKEIQLDKKDEKRYKNTTEMNASLFEVFKTMKKYYTGNKEYNLQKLEFDERLKKSEENFDKKLTKNQERNAKHDQQILAHMVRKIDLASQDYAENTEMVTNAVQVTAFATGGLTGWIADKLIKLTNMKGIGAKAMPWVIGVSLPIITGIYASKVQKQASRVGRFKAKQEMLNNPNSLVYVDKEKYEKIDVKQAEKQEKPNIFKFFMQLVKDNNEYNEYRKTELLDDLKRHKAVEKLNLSPEQLSDAKALQTNVFKTFNKVDEKSQTYSESVEALGEIVKQGVNTLVGVGMSAFMFKEMSKLIDNPKSLENESSVSWSMKTLKKMLLPLTILSAPIILIDVITTKKQKEASRVADMLALKEMEDYRHYAGYEDKSQSKEIKTKKESTNLLKQY